jgi:hypothetical protein
LVVVIDALRGDPKDVMLQKQGLSLLAYVLRDNIHTKFHLGDARRGALANGIVDVVIRAHKSYKEDDDIQTACKFLLELLAAVLV